MWHSALISNQLIDYYIPFLPLEVDDVVKCIRNEFKKHKLCLLSEKEKKEYISIILNEIIFETNEEKIFSKYGCKRIASLVRKLLIEKKLKLKLEF